MINENYFTEQNREDKISKWLKETRKYKNTPPFSIDLSNAVLIVMEMQKVFFSSDSKWYVPSASNIITVNRQIIDKFRKFNRPIIYTRNITSENSNNLWLKMWQEPISIHDYKSEIIEEIKGKGIFLIKRNYSAFQGTNLKAILSHRKIKQIVITGLISHLGCETTVREAFMFGYETFFVIDASASYTEDLHVGAIRAISNGFGVPILSDEILSFKTQ